jgi:hypothetical protein
MLTELRVSALQIEILGIKAGPAFVVGHVEEGVPCVLGESRKGLFNTESSASACGTHDIRISLFLGQSLMLSPDSLHKPVPAQRLGLPIQPIEVRRLGQPMQLDAISLSNVLLV